MVMASVWSSLLVRLALYRDTLQEQDIFSRRRETGVLIEQVLRISEIQHVTEIDSL